MCQVPVSTEGKEERAGQEGEDGETQDLLEVSTHASTAAKDHLEGEKKQEEEEALLREKRHGHQEDNDGMYDGAEARQTWANKAQFVLACIGYAVGLGNLWRFPYLCYKSGGGAFLIPYFLMLFLCGIPLLLMELTLGQYTRRGPIGALEKICPLFKGAGVGTVIMSFLLGTYYNVIIAWAIFYLFQSFTIDLP